jgi:hypothetical protein
MNFWRALLLILMIILCVASATARKEIESLSIVLADENGYGSCKGRFQIYSCHERKRLSDAPARPTFKVEIDDTLACRAVEQSTETTFPFLFTSTQPKKIEALLIIRHEKDTMILLAGTDPWLLKHNTNSSTLPLILQFKSGIFRLSDLRKDRSHIMLQNAVHRHTLLKLDNTVLSSALTISVPDRSYSNLDTVKITINGTAMTDGSCGDQRVTFTIQHWADNEWQVVHEYCCTQMDCGRGSGPFSNKTVGLFIQTSGASAHTALPSLQNPAGKYRVVLYDDLMTPVFSEHFSIE